MKKKFLTVLIIALTLLLALALAACNPTQNVDDDPPGYNDYDKTKFSVTFDSNGGTDFSGYNQREVVYGTSISKPTKNGVEDKPVKYGYTFKHWAISGATATDVFAAGNKKVTSNLTLIAQYTAKTFTHSVKLYEDSMEAQYKDFVSLSDSAVIKSTYASSSDTFSVPTTTKENDYFVYWYYKNDKGENVRFSTWALDPSDEAFKTTVAATTTYAFDYKLTLYAMWHSMLPEVKITYADSLSNTVYGVNAHKYKDTVPTDKAGEKLFEISKSGDVNFDAYTLTGWYYITEDEDGNEVENAFVFADADTDATALTEKTAVLDEDSGEYSLTLYARWQAKISVASKADFNRLYALAADEDTRHLLAGAYIEIADDFDLSGEEYNPLFNSDNAFTGIVDGGIYDGEGNFSGSCHTVYGGTFKGSDLVSVFGVSSGKIRNLILNGTVLSPDGTAQTALVAPFVSKNTGSISNCTYTDSSVNITAAGKTVVFGGIAALSGKGDVTNCNVSVNSAVFDVEGLSLGGIVGVNTNTAITGCTATLTASVTSADNLDGMGGSLVYIGGIAAENSAGTISKCRSALTVTSALADEIQAGGITGYNKFNGTVSKCSGVFTLGSATAKNLKAGGIVADNQGTVINCAANASIRGKASVMAFIGGIAGYNSSKLSYSYSQGEISGETSLVSARLYIGGITGYASGATLSNTFSLCDVNAVAPQGYLYTPAIGYSVGKATSTTSYTNVYYASDVTIEFNENDLSVEDAVLDTAEKAISAIKAAVKANFSSAEWIQANLDNASTKAGFNNTEIWTVANGSLPVLL
jgi:hypothetical protein